MKKTLFYLKKLAYWILALLSVLMVSIVLITYLYGDQLKQQIVKSLNTQINTPIEVEQIELSAFANFPFITLEFKNVKVRESIENSQLSLLEAETVHLIFNPISIFKGDYTVNSIALQNGVLNLKIDRFGRANYNIVKASPDGNSNSSFDINKISGLNMDIEWRDIKNQQHFRINAPSLAATLSLRNDDMNIYYEGFTDVEFISIAGTSYLENKKIWSTSSLTYNLKSYLLTFNDGIMSIDDSDFAISGNYQLDEFGKIALKIEGKNTNIQNLISLLPENLAKSLNEYQSTGDVYFDLELGGSLTNSQMPSVAAHFGFKNTNVTYPGSSSKITNCTFEGWYISNAVDDYETAQLTLSGLTGNFDGNPFTGNLLIKNFNEKYVEFDIQSAMNLNSLLTFYPIEYIEQGSGLLDIDLKFKGNLSDLKQKGTLQQVSSNGQISLNNVNLSIKGLTQSFHELNGSLLFNNHNIALNGFQGYIGKSQFLVNGILGNIFSWLLIGDDNIRIDAKLESEYVDLNELLALSGSDSIPSRQNYSLAISPLLHLSFDCNIKKLKFRRFDGSDISGILKVRDQLAMLQNIKLNEAGGTVNLEGLIDTKGKMIEVFTKVNMHEINIDSLFYVFEDFNQDFLVHDHLSGKMNSEVVAELRFTQNLEFIPQSLIADMGVTISGGELKNFEPMMLLADYLPKDNLKHLKFAELKNDIHIEDQRVYLPQMQIVSNVTTIMIGGTHTFDQHINYKIVAPLINKPRVDPDEVFGAIEDDGNSIPKIHLLLVGTTDDYQILLDKRGMKDQVVSNLKNEVSELKEAFKLKQKDKQKTLKLEEDEYIEWDNNLP